jgi:3-oxoacyl-[acyl-carrier protein] reductase
MVKDWQLKGRGALVTGSEGVIGKGIAEALAAEGVNVCSVDGEEGAEAIVRQATDALGHVDILVNAASEVRRGDRIAADVSAAAWNEAMDRDFELPRRLAHDLIPDMIEAGWGRIVNIIGPSEPLSFSVEYAASGALQGWAKSFDREIGAKGITINCIQPGIIKGTAGAAHYDEAELTGMEDPVIPFGEMGDAADIAHAVVFLCSPLSHYISAIVLPVDGGLDRHQH